MHMSNDTCRAWTNIYIEQQIQLEQFLNIIGTEVHEQASCFHETTSHDKYNEPSSTLSKEVTSKQQLWEEKKKRKKRSNSNGIIRSKEMTRKDNSASRNSLKPRNHTSTH